MRVVLMILGVLLILGGLGGLVLGVERHLAYSETVDRMGDQLEKAEDALEEGDKEAAERYAEYIDMDADTAASQAGDRNLFGAAGVGGLVIGVVLLVIGRRKKAAG